MRYLRRVELDVQWRIACIYAIDDVLQGCQLWPACERENVVLAWVDKVDIEI